MEVEVSLKGDEFKIYIDGKPHLKIFDRISGYQSYIKENKWYIIEFYVNSETIEVEYDSFEKWNKILTLIDKVL